MPRATLEGFGTPPSATHGLSMNGLNHAISGLAAYAGALLTGATVFHQTVPTPGTVAMGAIVAVGAGLAPDIDERHSKASQAAGALGSVARLATGAHRTRTHWPMLTIPLLTAWCWYLINVVGPGWAFGITCGVLLAVGWPFVAVAVLPRNIEGIFAVVSIPAGIYLAWYLHRHGVEPSWWLYAAVPVPYLAHIIGDTPTPAGIAWLGPVSSHKFSAHLFHSGGTVENSIVTPLLLALNAWLLWRLIDLGTFAGAWSL